MARGEDRSARQAEPTSLLAGRNALRLVSGLVLGEGLLMLVFAAIDLVSAGGADDPQWGAVWFVVCTLGLWGVGLLFVSRGVAAGHRRAFTPVLFTQLMFIILALNFLGAAAPAAMALWAAILVYAAAVLVLLFRPEVRTVLVGAPQRPAP